MKFTPSRIKQTVLSDNEQQALRGIADGVPAPAPMMLRSQKFGLVEMGHRSSRPRVTPHIPRITVPRADRPPKAA